MELAEFRQQIFTSLHTAKSRWQDSRLYLLYAPGYADPLGLAQGNDAPRRETTLLRWAHDAGYAKPQFPRVIELDCRRVAAHLLATDPAFDDPLLEESIALAHGGLAEEEGAGLCGWLVSPDSASTIASRFAGASQRWDTGQRYWLRWHDPRMMALLWPQMTAEQKFSLLGEQLSWLALDAAGHLVEFSSPSTAGNADTDANLTQLTVTRPQWTAIHHLGLVNHLVDAWREQRAEVLPPNACAAVQREIVRAQAWGLDGRDLQVFVLMALELRGSFSEDLTLQRVVQEAARNPGVLADLIAELPSEFWQRYGPTQ